MSSLKSIVSNVLTKFLQVYRTQQAEFPLQVLEKAIRWLKLKDCLQCRLVCRQWRKALDKKLESRFQLTGLTWISFLRSCQKGNKILLQTSDIQKLAELKPSLITRNTKAKTLRLQCFKNTLELVKVVSDVKQSQQSDPDLFRKNWEFLDLTEVAQRCIGQSLWNILIACRNLRVLIINLNHGIKDMPTLGTVSLPNLATYEIRMRFNEKRFLPLALFNLETPLLVNFGIEELESAYGSGIVNIMNIFSFVGKNFLTLKNLRIFFNLSPRLCRNNVEDQRFHNRFLDQISKVSLQKLDIRFVIGDLEPEFGNVVWTTLQQLIRSQRKCLRELSIETNSDKLMQEVHILVANNSRNLRKFNVELLMGTFSKGNIPQLKYLTALKKLRLTVHPYLTTDCTETISLPSSLQTLYWNAPLQFFPLLQLGSCVPGTMENHPVILNNLRKLGLVHNTFWRPETVKRLPTKFFNTSELNKANRTNAKTKFDLRWKSSLKAWILVIIPAACILLCVINE